MLRQPVDDIVVTERRRDPRIVVSLPGRYSLASKLDTRGQRRQFACRAINVSTSGIALAAPVRGAIGERVFAEIDYFGKLEGTTGRHLGDRGFLVHIAASDEQRQKLADKIDWFEKHKNLEVVDQRTEARFAPKDPYSVLLLEDGSMTTCFVIDLSVRGAGVSADIVPRIGAVLALGKVIGRVVRHFQGGFAIQFVTAQNRETLETMVSRNGV